MLDLKESFLLAATRKSKTKLRKTEKYTEIENNTDENGFIENEILDLNSLKPCENEPKSNIRDINSSSSDEQVMRVQ